MTARQLPARNSSGRSSGRAASRPRRRPSPATFRSSGLVKRAADGAYRRAGADAFTGDAQNALRRAVEEYLRTQESIQQLLVLRTDPGQAQPLAIAIDRARVPEIAGTIGGDDTILVICRSAAEATAIADRFRTMKDTLTAVRART